MLQTDDGVGTIQFSSTVPTPSSPVIRSCVPGSLKPACFIMLFRKAASGIAHFWKVEKLSRTMRTVTGVPWANWLPIVFISFVAKSVALAETGWAKRLILDAHSKLNSMETLMCMEKCGDNPLFKPQPTTPRSYAVHFDSKLSDELRISAQKLGPFAAASLTIFVDLGLRDDDIGRYFGLPNFRVGQLCQAWRIAASR